MATKLYLYPQLGKFQVKLAFAPMVQIGATPQAASDALHLLWFDEYYHHLI
jgi:hypothetical protein